MLAVHRKTLCYPNMEPKKSYLDVLEACFWTSVCETVRTLTIVTEGQNATTPDKPPLEH